MNDKLINCNRCGSNCCYETPINEQHKSWFCFGCGFTSNSLMVEDSMIVKANDEAAPELVKDLKFKDNNGYIWYPSNINIPNKGMVFVDGTNKNNWKWAYAPSILLTKEDKISGKFPNDQKYKIDPKNVKYFEQSDFMDACEQIGLFGLIK